MTLKSLALAGLVVLLAGCEKSNDPTGEVNSIDLSVGSAWTYDWHYEQYSPTGELLWDTTSQFIAYVSAINQTVGPYQGLTLMEARNRDYPSGTSEVWYSQTNERLTEVAYRSPGNTPIILPKRSGKMPSAASLATMGLPFGLPYGLRQVLGPVSVADSILLRDDPRVVCVYPLVAGASWVSFSSPFLQERTVDTYEDVAVPAGAFHSAKIRTTLPTFTPRFTWFDYVSSHGLVKRTFESWVAGLGEDPPVPVDSVRIVESLVLRAH